jgi:MSHA biogenesis protein MshM
MASHELMSAIFARLLDLSREGKQVVLIVDEAQAMPRETIEGLRLLTNLETEKRKLLQVVILGQPELDVLLARADLRQLKQRIIFAEYLSPFTRSGVRDYIQHRVKAAGQMARIFSSGSENLVYLATGGIPRLINILCHKALIRAYGRGNPDVTVWHIAEAILDTAECTQPGKIAARFCSLNLLAPAMRAPG